MKLRMREGSIRLRLTRSEVERLGESDSVEETVDFGTDFGGPLSFSIGLGSSGTAVRAESSTGKISVIVPRHLAENWMRTEQVGIEAEQATGDGTLLRVTIEKDFACLKPRVGEDESDSFPNPMEGAAC